MNFKVVLLATVVVLILAYGAVFWWAAESEPLPLADGAWGPAEDRDTAPEMTEVQEPTLLTAGGPVSCDPFTEFREDRDATRAKYKDKTVLLYGVARYPFGYEGSYFLTCAGPNGQTFVIRVNDDDNFKKVRIGNRVVVKGVLNPHWSGEHQFFANIIVWDGSLQEIQVAGGTDRKVIWKIKEE